VPGQEYTMEQVAQHKSKESIWIVLHNKVLDVTRFLELHPGGDEVLLEQAGTDATATFESIGHSEDALALTRTYQIGMLKAT